MYDRSRPTEGDRALIIMIRDGLGRADEVVLPVSVMMEGESQGLGYGGQSEEDEKEGTWRP
jgi:hypothetical protein